MRPVYNRWMTPKILGLHHVTATVDEAQADLDFCIDLLGMRLVKKTVNFDNHNVYHFYYGTELGAPGTIWTTFPVQGLRRARRREGRRAGRDDGVLGADGSLEFWRTRLRQACRRVQRYRVVSSASRRLASTIPAGLRFELIAGDRDERAPWTREVAADAAIRGLHSVQMMVRQARTIGRVPDESPWLATVVGSSRQSHARRRRRRCSRAI